MPIVSDKLRRRIVEQGKSLLVQTNRSRPLRFAGERAYDAMRLVIRQRFASTPGVRAVYLCHSLAAGECYPGLSDFDIAVVFDDADPVSFYDRIRRRWGALKRYFPISDLSILTVAEFETWQRVGGGWDPLDEVRNWKLLAGEELRHSRFDAGTEEAATDRMQWALGHFQNLLGVVIKEEQKSPLMAVIARRQLHKNFWNTVLALDPRYLAIPAHRDRVAAWIADNGTPPCVAAMQEMYAARFISGPVTTMRMEAGALAYQLLDHSLARNSLLTRRLTRPRSSHEAVPISNHAEVEDRGHAFSASILEMLGDVIESVTLGSTGSVRGYALYIVLRDGLSSGDLAGALRDIRAVHRVFDDPWFNEHIPAGIPTVCSRSMFIARLHTGRSSLHYFEKFRCVLHGRDLYAEVVSDTAGPETEGETLHDWRREHLLYSLHLHQVYLARLKPALHDYVTFYFPRMMLQRKHGIAPATAEEAVAVFAGLHPGGDSVLPARMLEEYRGKDLDALLKTMTRQTFSDVWPMLSQGLHANASAP